MTNIHRILGAIVAFTIGLLAAHGAHAQYSQTVFDLKKASDLYDERGFEQGKAISVDGKLVVSNSNGNVSYSYPISSHMEGGHMMDVTLNYCGSVGFTAFTRYQQANHPGSSGPKAGGLYTGWEKFHQNRPAWILGVNGFAINAIATASHFHADPHSRVHSGSVTSFNDADLIWTIDGYDACNTMYDFGAVGAGLNGGVSYVDEINLLRADGSLMHLINIQPPTSTTPDRRPELYTGYYFANEANQRGFGYVELDSTYWTPALRSALRYCDTIPKGGRDTVNHITHQRVIVDAQDSVWCIDLMPGQEYPLLPRKLHYYPGDGLEYVFREWRAPYGMPAYRDLVERGGGYWGSPSIFYLEEIRGSAGVITSFTRARHYPIFGNPMFESREDTTRGRALITSFPGHQLSFGYNSMIIEGMGRTTKVVFDVIARSGNATSTEMMPFANNGGITGLSLGLATYAETNAALYKSFVGYVTKIIDPENRVTSFEYEPVTRTYQNMGFPYTPVSGNVNVALKNYRLKAVNEPTARYVLKYYGANTQTITTSTAGAMDGPQRLNDVVDSVLKFDLAGNPLTATKYYFEYNTAYDNFTELSQEFYRDLVTDSSRTTTYEYRPDQLPNLAPLLPPARFTELYRVTESAGEMTTITETAYTTTGVPMTINRFGTSYPITGTILPTPYMILPTSTVTTINGTPKSLRSYSYTIDTARTYGGDAQLAALFGGELATKVTTTLRPDAPTVPLLVDTTRYLHLRYIDTTMTWTEREWKKRLSMNSFFYHRDTLGDPRLQDSGSWEKWMYIPPVGVYVDTSKTELVHIPPLFGLQSYSSTSDASGILAGKVNHYLSDLQNGANRYLRGQLLSDTIIGRGGVRLPGTTYEWDGPYLVSTTNALGARKQFGYDYGFLRRDTNGNAFITPGIPEGGRVANDQTTTMVRLEYNPFERMYSTPGAERSIVRRYSGSGLAADSLTSYAEHSFFGRVAATIDPNGWYSRFAYDKIGRLTTAWLPYDFPRTGDLDTVSYVGNEPIELYGTTNYQRRPDVLECRKAGGIATSTVVEGTPVTTTLLDTLYAYRPPTEVPECPCENDPEMTKRGVRELMATCNQDLTYNEHSGFDGFYGVMNVRVDAASPLQRAVTIDSSSLDMMITAINGDCGELEVKIPGTGFVRTFVLACSSGPELPDNPGSRVTGIADDTRSKHEGATALLSGDGSSLRPVAGGYLLHVNLSSIVDTLKTRSAFRIELRSKTVGTAIAFASGFSGADVRPRINVYGRYKRVWDGADYTLNYAHNDTSLTTVIRAKVDDAEHTAGHFTSPAIRRATSKHYFGADYRVLRTDDTVILAGGAQRTDIVRGMHSGAGQALRAIDQEGDTVQTRYDAAGRPIATVNTDGSQVTIDYADGTPASLSLSGEYYGFARRVRTTNERGIRHEQYYDAFDRLRRDVMNAGGSAPLVTQYEYDLLGRVTTVTNPKGDVTSYTYDDFGRVASKSMPDLGTVSYAYDALGNMRFTQSQEQFAHNLLGFTQYDDLNRPTVIGEAVIYRQSICGPFAEDYLTGGCAATVPGSTPRLTAQADPNRMNIGAMSDTTILTANPTLAMTPLAAQPSFFVNGSTIDGRLSMCLLPPSLLLGETSAPVGPLVRHWAGNYESYPTTATLDDFEDMAAHTEFARIAISYDKLPDPGKSVWKHFPPRSQWNALAPRGQVMNLKGREAAVAYRERASEPFHYTVMSYDERGRVEAILRCTENIGFDAVYYRYNSMNLVTSVTASDALRSHTTWYGYDHQGRVDSVWTTLGPVGSGLIPEKHLPPPGATSWPIIAMAVPQDMQMRAPQTVPDITYDYTKLGQVSAMRYPPANVLVEYAYNRRKWLTSLIARDTSSTLGMIFREQLTYDSTGQITEQRYKHGTGSEQVQTYGYDSTDRLTWWTQNAGIDTVGYSYDAVGNRTKLRRNWDLYPENYSIIAGRNQLELRKHHDAEIGDTLLIYEYNRNGSLTRRRMQHDSSTGAWTNWPTWPKPSGLGQQFNEELRYSYRNLLNRVWHTDSSRNSYDWRYRYSASGEREQKRLVRFVPWVPPVVTHPIDTPSIAGGWVYYLLGAHNEQLAVYHGQQDTGNVCSDTSAGVSMYPTEYLTHGIGYTGVPEDISQVITDASGNKQYRISDHLATLRATVGGSGISSYDSDPWGGALEAPVTGESRRVFNDRERDRETGNLNLGVRSEEPSLGRFTSVDPLAEKSAGQSPYVYADNNPLRFTDPNGMQAREGVTDAIVDGLGDAAEGIGETILDAFIPYVAYKRITERPTSLDERVESVKEAYGIVTGQRGSYQQTRFITNHGAQIAFWAALGKLGGGLGEAEAATGKAASNAEKLLERSQSRALRSLERQVAEHRQKLADYKANPEAYDNLGHLKKAPTPEIKQKIIDSRVRHLEKEIQEFQKQIDAIKGK